MIVIIFISRCFRITEVQFRLFLNDIEAGVTLHRMRRNFDKGEIYAKKIF